MNKRLESFWKQAFSAKIAKFYIPYTIAIFLGKGGIPSQTTAFRPPYPRNADRQEENDSQQTARENRLPSQQGRQEERDERKRKNPIFKRRLPTGKEKNQDRFQPTSNK